MVEVEAVVVLLGRCTDGDGLVTRELQLLNQILVRARGEPLALIGIQIDVVNPQGGSGGDCGADTSGRRCKGKVELDLMILKSNALIIHISKYVGLYLRSSI